MKNQTDFLLPRDGAVVPGLEAKEIVYAKDQPEYIPLRTLRGQMHAGAPVLSRWTLTPEQRKAIADGADVFLELLTLGHPLQPIRIFVTGEVDTETVCREYGL